MLRKCIKNFRSIKAKQLFEKVTLANSSDIFTSGNGIWEICGYSSYVEVRAVIEDRIGKAIDVEILTSKWKYCESWKRQKGPFTYKQWKTQHEKKCLKNHRCSSGMM
ncbi:hypothetical protein NPIL_663301 [Nephila pilipes]|uniref:Uncharacterized protein n=1 Tax=Nephila pilipes TaxID=299642 RepID=A0A8X6MYC4_NEPPI|nr:hypothetical protein NPIL_663301 [Nephila pilipes]